MTEPVSVQIDGSTKCRHGTFVWPAGDRFVGRSMKLYGEWCEAELELMAKFLKPGDCVIEAGANIGADTVPLSRLVMPGMMFAFEPQHAIFTLMNANLQKNNCANVVGICAGTHLKPGKAFFPRIDYSGEDNFGGVALGLKRHSDSDEEVLLMALDDVIPAGTKVALIKADVEGMELSTLLGAARIIGENRPVLYVENNLGPHSAELIRWLTQINYRCWWHTVPLYRPDNYAGSTDNAFPDIVSSNMLGLMTGDPRIELVQELGLAPVLGPRDMPVSLIRRPDRPTSTPI